ncbi:MAG: spermidine/putrescine ABC transporter substrate-binding protein [Nitrospirota bacterium]|nr:MAG: spermidine/putrescine ABC transporter substrate-binding protein [Nitrospirota bacterium]
MALWGRDSRVFWFILATHFLFVGCGQSEEERNDPQSSAPSPQTLYYFTWSDYADPALLTEFEKRTGTRVVVDTFSSNEELLAKVQSGASGYDVVVPSDFMAGVMAKLGLLAELDLQRIPNVKLLEEHLQELPFDPHQKFAIPYLWGTVGIGYDSEVFPNPPDSWEILWDTQYRGRISMLNDQREVIGMALRSMGHSLNSRDPLVIQEVKEKLIRQKPLVKTYTSEHFDQLLVSGEVVLAHAWGGPIARATRERPSVKYVVPREGGTIWTDCLAVSKTSKKKKLAMEFINYLLEVDVAVKTSNQLLFASANRLVKDRVEKEVRENPAVYPPLAIISRMEWMTDVGEAIRYYDRAWTELKVH